MSTAALIALFLENLKQRADAGFPVLKKFLDKWLNRIQAAIPQTTDIVTFGAAPPDLLATIVKFLEDRRAESGLVMKVVFQVLIAAVPSVINELWDRLFTMSLVAQGSSAFPELVTFNSSQDCDLTALEGVFE
jgi:hypothetical protein